MNKRYNAPFVHDSSAFFESLALTSFGSYNTGYTAHSVRPNSAKGGTSYSPNTLGVIGDEHKIS